LSNGELTLIAGDYFSFPFFTPIAAQVRDAGWRYRELAIDHFGMIDQPSRVAELLLALV
jgi:hypothetical protein